MHDLSDSTVTRISAIIAFLLLVSIPVLFRKPATTLLDITEIAIHASVLSLSDSIWSGSRWTLEGIEPPLPGEVAFGVHNFYPYKLFTVRDVRTGDILVKINSPINQLSNAHDSTRGDIHIKIVVRDRDVLVILQNQDSGSWPARLFSSMTGG